MQYAEALSLASSLKAFSKEWISPKISLESFVRRYWHIIEPAQPLVWDPYMTVLCRILEDIADGKYREFVINIPPRHMKSILVSVMFPCWMWIRKPWFRFLTTSHSQSVVNRDSRAMRKIITSDLYQQMIDYDWGLTKDQNQKVNFENTKTGYRKGFPLLGGVTGEGANGIINDDPYDAKSAVLGSMDQINRKMERPIHVYEDVLESRLNNQSSDWRLTIMQQLHVNDLSNHLIRRGVPHLVLPFEYDPDHPQCSPLDPRNQRGQLLSPSRFSPEVVESFKRSPYKYASQYQQRPAPAEGSLFKKHWFDNFYTVNPFQLLHQLRDYELGITIDCSFKGDEQNDFNVAQAWARKGSKRYLLDQLRIRCNYAEFKIALIRFMSKFQTIHFVLVEDKANGSALIADLKAEIPGVLAFNPGTQSKTERAQIGSINAYMAGDILLPHPSICPWILDFITEHLAFGPGCANDDQIDAESQIILHWLVAVGVLKKVKKGLAFLNP